MALNTGPEWPPKDFNQNFQLRLPAIRPPRTCRSGAGFPAGLQRSVYWCAREGSFLRLDLMPVIGFGVPRVHVASQTRQRAHVTTKAVLITGANEGFAMQPKVTEAVGRPGFGNGTEQDQSANVRLGFN